MGESTKAVCALLLMVASIAAAVAWAADRPDAATWGFRVGCPIAAVLALGLILKLDSRTDLARDYLREFAGTYFNRDGFCFAIVATAVDDVAYMDACFQSQHDQPCIGRIAVRPARGFFRNRAKIDTITYEIECPPAGFGYARIAIPIPKMLQGKSQSFEVGAAVRYPHGKGRRLRFHDGIFLRTDSSFGNAFGTALTVAGAATGQIVLSKPVTTKVELPIGVADDIPVHPAPEIAILWQLGEPQLEMA